MLRVMAVGLIGSKDHGVEDASKRKKDTSTVTLKSNEEERSFHDNTEEGRGLNTKVV